MSRDIIENYTYMVWPHLEEDIAEPRCTWRNEEEARMVAALDAKRALEQEEPTP